MLYYLSLTWGLSSDYRNLKLSLYQYEEKTPHWLGWIRMGSNHAKHYKSLPLQSEEGKIYVMRGGHTLSMSSHLPSMQQTQFCLQPTDWTWPRHLLGFVHLPFIALQSLVVLHFLFFFFLMQQRHPFLHNFFAFSFFLHLDLQIPPFRWHFPLDSHFSAGYYEWG